MDGVPDGCLKEVCVVSHILYLQRGFWSEGLILWLQASGSCPSGLWPDLAEAGILAALYRKQWRLEVGCTQHVSVLKGTVKSSTFEHTDLKST